MSRGWWTGCLILRTSPAKSSGLLVVESAYQSPQEIVIGVLKSWKRDKSSYAYESDIWAIYASRNSLQLDEEKAECLLQSAIYRHAPFFFFAKLLSRKSLISLIRDQIGVGKYPAPNAAAKLAHAIGGKVGGQLLDHIADHCGYLGTEKAATNLKKLYSNQTESYHSMGLAWR